MLVNEISTNKLRDVMLLGNAIFTLLSDRTDVYFTYKVKRHREWVGCYDVFVLMGTSNLKYTYLCTIMAGKIEIKRPAPMTRWNTKWANYMLKYKTFCWLHRILKDGPESIPSKAHILSVNRCWRCGKMLTTPESIDRGIGPECIKAKY